jgi:hypothetical protein
MDEERRREIEERLERINERLASAAEYVAQNVNVEGRSFLHFDDWQGKSGHPSWMRNYMIPTTMKVRARTERVLDNIENKTKDKKLTKRKRRGKRRSPIV